MKVEGRGRNIGERDGEQGQVGRLLGKVEREKWMDIQVKHREERGAMGGEGLFVD